MRHDDPHPAKKWRSRPTLEVLEGRDAPDDLVLGLLTLQALELAPPTRYYPD